MSGKVTVAQPSSRILRGTTSLDADTKTVGGTVALGKECVRGAAPRDTCR